MDTSPSPRRRRSLPWSLFASFRESLSQSRNDTRSGNELPIQTQANTQTPSEPSQTLALARAQLPTPPRTPPERAIPRPPFPRNTAPNGRRIRPTRLDPIPEETAPDEHVETLAKENTRKRKQRQEQDGTGRRPVPTYAVPDASRVGARSNNDLRRHAFDRAAPPPFDRNQVQPLLGREHPGAAFRRNTPFMLERPDRFVINPLTSRRPPARHHASYFTEIVDRPGGPPVPPFRPSGVPIPDGRPNPFLPPEMQNRRGEPAPPSPRPRLRHSGRSIGSLRSVAQAQSEPSPTRQDPFAGFNDSSRLIERRSGKEMPARYRGGTPKGG
ncbi:hypothetical protein DTO280E4_1072 [Paecilomyces variotii]|nr:hypothetical protein DTO280E4_1072 [Paecilomyces variotii]KAJ9369625.1 hypothetical protein DTO282E5_5754 [Paecilomyces variotii]